MPIQSKAQWREMFANQPALAKKWEKEHPVSYNDLPTHKGGRLQELHKHRLKGRHKRWAYV